MALQTDTVDARTIRLDKLDNAGGALSLFRAVLEVVVIVEEAGVWVGGLGVLEGDGDVGLANGLEEDVVAVGAVFVESCVAWSVEIALK